MAQPRLQSQVAPLTQASHDGFKISGALAERPTRSPGGAEGPRSLVAICVGFLGRFLEELADDMHLLAPAWPTPIKLAIAAIARRRGLLDDELLRALVDDTWTCAALADGHVTDAGVRHLSAMCSRLVAVDVSRCDAVSADALVELVMANPSLHTLRFGGTARSDAVARAALRRILPRLREGAGADDGSWEELSLESVGAGAQALRWIVWRTADERSLERLRTQCPVIGVNARWRPPEADPDAELDDAFLAGIDPDAWSTRADVAWRGAAPTGGPSCPAPPPGGGWAALPLAERFRLAYAAREARLAPKRAKNARQAQRRAERERLTDDPAARARQLAERAMHSLRV